MVQHSCRSRDGIETSPTTVDSGLFQQSISAFWHDVQVANVTGALKAAGLYDSSVMLFMSDNVRVTFLLTV